MRLTTSGTVGALIIAVLLAACGSSSTSTSSSSTFHTLDASAIEGHIKTQVQQQLGLTVSSASCPSGQPGLVGKNFTCTMTLSSGETEQMAVIPNNNKGLYTIRPAQMIATYVQATIEQRAARQGLQLTASCPQHVAIVVGKRFDCTIATPAGQRAILGVTINDHDGNFTPDHHPRPA
jgi:hypothetical protein